MRMDRLTDQERADIAFAVFRAFAADERRVAAAIGVTLRQADKIRQERFSRLTKNGFRVMHIESGWVLKAVLGLIDQMISEGDTERWAACRLGYDVAFIKSLRKEGATFDSSGEKGEAKPVTVTVSGGRFADMSISGDDAEMILADCNLSPLPEKTPSVLSRIGSWLRRRRLDRKLRHAEDSRQHARDMLDIAQERCQRAGAAYDRAHTEVMRLRDLAAG